MMKRLFFFLAFFSLLPSFKAQVLTLSSGGLQLSVDEEGYYQSIKVEGQEVLRKGHLPVVMAGIEGALSKPFLCQSEGAVLHLTMEDGGGVDLAFAECNTCITMEVKSVSPLYDAVFLTPFSITLDEVIGEVVGIVQGEGLAFGVQALNLKTNAGLPQAYADQMLSQFGCIVNPRFQSMVPIREMAAMPLEDGVMMQFHALRRNEVTYQTVNGVDNVMVLPIADPDALMEGAKIAFFGCRQEELMARIGTLELEMGLPHPLLKGEWVKTSRNAKRSYMLADFSPSDLSLFLDKCQLAGLNQLCHTAPFNGGARYHWSPTFAKNGSQSVRNMVDEAAQRGIMLGVCVKPNLILKNDAYVTPVPSKHLLKQGALRLQTAITADQTDFALYASDLFSKPSTLNVLQIGDELISFRTTEPAGDIHLLHSCQRGAFGTKKSAHAKNETVYKLWDHPYPALLPDLTLQDECVGRLVKVIGDAQLPLVSFEDVQYGRLVGHDDYASARLLSRFNEQNEHVLLDANALSHFSWHYGLRMNPLGVWNERLHYEEVESRSKTADFNNRNLLPNMLGRVELLCGDSKHLATTMEELEWTLSEGAGFDAGFGFQVDKDWFRKCGKADLMLQAIRNWETLRLADAFTPALKEQLRDPYSNWHLEQVSDSLYELYPLNVSRRYLMSMSAKKTGERWLEEWRWNTAYQGSAALQILVEGDAEIKNPSIALGAEEVVFPCRVGSRQYLICDNDGHAMVTDENFNLISKVEPVGRLFLSEASNDVVFSCEGVRKGKGAAVTVRFFTKDEPITIQIP